jgi:hypothetical protein
MPTPPPVPSSQRYPIQLRDFCTYQDQPGDGNHILSTIDPSTGMPVTTDLTIDYAAITGDMHTEVISIEKTIGTRPFTPPSCTTVGQGIGWLYNNKASLVHGHMHGLLTALTADDHPEYELVNGRRPFTAPITAPAASNGNQLVNYNQVTGAHYITTAQFQSMLASNLASRGSQVSDPYGQRLQMMGGVAQGYTDANGLLYVQFGSGFKNGVLTFVYMKMPYPLASYFYGYVFQYMEDQLVLMNLSNQGATIQFIEDVQVDRQAWVSLCWMAIGI